jgi:hypothetical protein
MALEFAAFVDLLCKLQQVAQQNVQRSSFQPSFQRISPIQTAKNLHFAAICRLQNLIGKMAPFSMGY